jgi:hypothetical protein
MMFVRVVIDDCRQRFLPSSDMARFFRNQPLSDSFVTPSISVMKDSVPYVIPSPSVRVLGKFRIDCVRHYTIPPLCLIEAINLLE